MREKKSGSAGECPDMAGIPVRELIKAACAARENSYAPYSHFTVGAALLCTDGTLYCGCNVENAAFGPSCCAERIAVFKAASEGKRKFQAIAVTGGAEGEEPSTFAWPCGVCRQVLAEFADPAAFFVIAARTKTDYEIAVLGDLLPFAFGPDNLCRS